jgi:hypothetical protein
MVAMARMRSAIGGFCLSMLVMTAHAAGLQPGLAGLDFLVGSWTNGAGKVAETGGSSKGSSHITVDAGGAVLLRRDHVELFDKAGKPGGSFDILMTIYAEDGGVRADYFDGDHHIHYTSAAIVPGRSVAFTSAPSAGRPVFRLIYRRAADELAISFAMAPPGQASFHAIADGTLRRGGD